ncbi:ANTAR domain-containing protein [Streptomyces sp. NPDC102476]|uniref:ANTAR domain-containing protein n=1 Tax=Streptomyces sp. NPDC102476 TaxID=3366181 RepID=UPI00381F7CBA
MPESVHSAQRLTTLDARPPCLATIEAKVAGERTDVTCRGEFDIGAQALQSELYAVLDRSATGVDLDLSGVGFCDCGGLNLLLDLRREALAQGKTVTVQAYSPAVGRLLELTGARELFVTEDSAHSDAPAAPVHEAWSRPKEVDQELRLEVDQLRRAMRTRPTIDVARGIVMATFALSAEDAWTVLVTASQNTNTKLYHLAQDLLGAVDGTQVPEELRQQIAVAVAKVRETATTPSDDIAERETGPETQCLPPPPAA